MSRVRIRSVAGPLRLNPRAAQRAALLLARAETMGFLGDEPVPDVLDDAVVRRLVRNLGEIGVALAAGASTGENLEQVIELALEGSEHSPMPAGEWPVLVETLSEGGLAALLGISETSLRRYLRGERREPDEVASRLHVLALIVSDLAGAYNPRGIRGWFARSRTALDSQSPAQLLTGDWDPEGPDALRVRGLAASLVSAGAA